MVLDDDVIVLEYEDTDCDGSREVSISKIPPGVKNGFDRSRYRLDHIVSHQGRGSQTKYLVQLESRHSEGQRKKIWLYAKDIAPDLLGFYRERLRILAKREELNQRKTSRIYRRFAKVTLSPRPFHLVRDMSVQVDKRDFCLPDPLTNRSNEARRPIFHEVATQTDVTYFVWDMVSL